jgi:hypothetical protein
VTAPKRRQLVVLLNDDEWRRLRVLVAERDTTLTAWTTDVVLSAVQTLKTHSAPASTPRRAARRAP